MEWVLLAVGITVVVVVVVVALLTRSILRGVFRSAEVRMGQVLDESMEQGHDELLRVTSVLRDDIAEVRSRAASGAAHASVDTALARATQHAEAFGAGGFTGAEHLYRATESLASVNRTLAPTGRPPCLFNPVHGPATAEADWSPGDGMPRRVPVCAADAERISSGQEPLVRRVPTGSGPRPYFAVGGLYADWVLGWYAGEDPYLTARLLVGTELGQHLPDRIQARRSTSATNPMGTFGTVHP